MQTADFKWDEEDDKLVAEYPDEQSLLEDAQEAARKAVGQFFRMCPKYKRLEWGDLISEALIRVLGARNAINEKIREGNCHRGLLFVIARNGMCSAIEREEKQHPDGRVLLSALEEDEHPHAARTDWLDNLFEVEEYKLDPDLWALASLYAEDGKLSDQECADRLETSPRTIQRQKLEIRESLVAYDENWDRLKKKNHRPTPAKGGEKADSVSQPVVAI